MYLTGIFFKRHFKLNFISEKYSKVLKKLTSYNFLLEQNGKLRLSSEHETRR